MKRSEAFPSQYMSKDDVASPVQLTVADVRFETIKTDHGEESKPVVIFQEAGSKSMILNNTNWETVEGAYGPESDEWRGRLIELYLDPGVMFGGKKVGGVRIRIPNSNAGGNSDLSYEQAIEECAKVGITKEQLVDRLKENGLTSYSPASATPHVEAMIRTAKNDIPF